MSSSITKYIDGVVDSSRYYVLRLTNKQGQVAMIGMGFRDRDVSFDFKSVINEFIKYADRSNALAGGVAVPAQVDSQLPVPDSLDDEADSDATASGYAGIRGAPSSAPGAGVGLVTAPLRDLSLKEGQTIKISLGTRAGHTSKPKTTGAAGGLLPPPAAGMKLPKPQSAASFSVPMAASAAPDFDDDDFDEFVSA